MTLKTINLSIGYQTDKTQTLIMKDVNICALEAEVVAIIGSNGAGKTTLLKTLAHILRALKGDIEWNGLNLSKINNDEKARILSFISTDSANLGAISVKEFIALGRFPYTNWLGQLKKNDLKLINFAAEILQIKKFLDKNISELSDGQKQKISIARAIVQDTPVILLDEPAAFLDVENKFSLMQILSNLSKKHKKTIIYSTHDLELALQSADKIWLFTKNEIFQGAPEDLVRNENIQNLFSDKLYFDKKSFSFKQKIYRENTISVPPEDDNFDLIVHTANRIGYNIDVNAKLKVHTVNKIIQITDNDKKVYDCQNYYMLAQKLKTFIG